MNKKILVIITIVLITILNLNIAKAEEMKEEISKQMSTPETSTYYNKFNKVKTTFYKNGVIIFNKNTINTDNLIYYDFNGKVISSVNLKDLFDEDDIDINYMEEHNEYLYLLTNKGMYKLDSSLEKVASNNDIIIYLNGSARSRLEYGVKQMYFTEEGIYLPEKYFIDYDLEEFSEVISNDNYVYLEEDTGLSISPVYGMNELKSACGLTEIDGENGRYFSCDKKDEYIIASGSGWDIQEYTPIRKKAHMSLYKNGEKLWSIINKDYDAFTCTKLYKNIIITIAGKKDESIYNYRSDILFYDLEGNYIGKIEESEMLYSLTISDEKFALGKQVVDGICTRDKYNMSDSGCDSITNFEVYSLGTSKVNPPEEDSSGINITNPETSSPKISYIFIILLGSLSIGLLIRNKIKL